MNISEIQAYRRLYETERQLPNRNFAKDHSFAEWLDNLLGSRGEVYGYFFG